MMSVGFDKVEDSRQETDSDDLDCFGRKCRNFTVYPVLDNSQATTCNKDNVDSLVVRVRDLLASWSHNAEKPVLEGISFEVNEVIKMLFLFCWFYFLFGWLVSFCLFVCCCCYCCFVGVLFSLLSTMKLIVYPEGLDHNRDVDNFFEKEGGGEVRAPPKVQ